MNWFWQSLYSAAVMLWETLWALVLGFSLSAMLQVFSRKDQVSRHFGRTGLREVALATVLGAVSSSCSYAAAATARTAFKKGAALVPVLAFMFASTNLVFELGFLLWLLLGWQFVVAEIVGSFFLIGLMWLLVKLTLPNGLVETARAYEGGKVEDCCGGHGAEAGEAHEHSSAMKPDMDADMDADMNPEEATASTATFGEKFRSGKSWSRVADAFFMDAVMLWKEVAIGFLAAGFLMVLVPESAWGKLFITHTTGFVHLLENAVVGPLAGMASFACSCGNIPLASVLWSGGISFGGVISFVYADLVIIPLILIYRKYYGPRAATYITLILFASMVGAGIIVDLLFGVLGLIPSVRPPHVMAQSSFQWNYTTWLDFLALVVIGCFMFMHFKNRRGGKSAHMHGH